VRLCGGKERRNGADDSCQEDCLHCAINTLVVKRLQKNLARNTAVDATAMAAALAQSLSDMIVHAAPPEERANLLAYAVQHLGRCFLTETGAVRVGPV
jgi:hypothetical protein